MGVAWLLFSMLLDGVLLFFGAGFGLTRGVRVVYKYYPHIIVPVDLYSYSMYPSAVLRPNINAL